MKSPIYLESSLDLIDEGVIVVDKNKIIRVYNHRAREIFYTDPRIGPGHPSGKIQSGDLVVVADISIGGDDGDLEPDDFRLLGIEPGNIRPGDGIAAVGFYGGEPGSAVWKAVSSETLDRSILLDYTFKGQAIRSQIDDFSKKAIITVDGVSYEIPYQVCVGHLVIIDPQSGRLKFYQARGYTARNEDIKQILLGKPYVAKGPQAMVPELLGKHISEIHPDSPGIRYLDRIIEEKVAGVRDMEFYINGIYARCSVYPVQVDGILAGAALVLRDITELMFWQKKAKDHHKHSFGLSRIIGQSRAILEAVQMAHRFSQSRSTLLLLGESGTGKGLFARAIHENSPRRSGPFIHVNMAAIPDNLLESELFGYEEGAFTGARKSGKPGKFVQANGGTIFLDEIGELDPVFQAKLLLALQEHGTIQTVGGTNPVNVDIRIIAATNKNLEAEVKKGSFREDLFYRLNVISLTIPPLRSRKEDIPYLIEDGLPRISSKVGKRITKVSERVKSIFMDYAWPGNVRELENVLERAANLAERDVVTEEDLPQSFRKRVENLTFTDETPAGCSLKNMAETAERDAIIKALQACNGNRTRAMQMLNIGRTAFYQKLKRYGIK